MGPKRKVLKSGWEECRFCRIILQSTDVLGHIKSFHSGEESKCDELKSPSYATRSSQSIAGSHGFIKGDIVHGFVREIVNSSKYLNYVTKK